MTQKPKPNGWIVIAIDKEVRAALQAERQLNESWNAVIRRLIGLGIHVDKRMDGTAKRKRRPKSLHNVITPPNEDADAQD